MTTSGRMDGKVIGAGGGRLEGGDAAPGEDLLHDFLDMDSHGVEEAEVNDLGIAQQQRQLGAAEDDRLAALPSGTRSRYAARMLLFRRDAADDAGDLHPPRRHHPSTFVTVSGALATTSG